MFITISIKNQNQNLKPWWKNPAELVYRNPSASQNQSHNAVDGTQILIFILASVHSTHPPGRENNTNTSPV